ncbi:MAG: tRNA (adenosine(37)-N6)-dimethylallyltransferase MiaA [Parcubacteria group bacterium]|jgi:tRNA dimethylallyltransferase
MNDRQKVIVILGPTASGKSSAAIKLAKKFNGEIISADSRQIYRSMDIGTGKVTGSIKSVIPNLSRNLGKNIATVNRKLRTKNQVFISQGIRHYMLDIVSPKTKYSVAKFKKRAEKHIKDILKRGKLPIICGGTGFWIKALVDNITYPEVNPDWGLRKNLEKESLEYLFEKLKEIDPQRASTVDKKNKVRLIRAIEICHTLGSVPKNNQKNDNKYKFLQIGILREKEILHKRIRLNIMKRFKMGMISEVEKLHKEGLGWKKIESFGLSYKLIPMFLRKEILSSDELLEKIYLAEKNYAKRQTTWFKKDSRIIWLTDYKDIQKKVSLFLASF